ncbi:carboxypeptidase regulatory-like domain-containing protein [Nocardioides sp.]|uniref:carboxypeptidase regulatory-like domain-containing protein n=1 Tax=Nocardioides sp. TaxID=35761 RepID=UPI001A29BD75|nr:carboxypeptidase regulatory-like domain-containing protein [Nocardioides sp.]MBJ7358220.1 carboxypeptidase regulatory-like domain-containing protein [Nocardioides sp.]
MTRSRLARTALLLVPALVSAGLAAASPAPATAPVAAPPVAAGASAPAAESRTWDATYYSSPPPLAGTADRADTRSDRAAPQPAPTSGFVTGRVIGPGGKPVKQALVYGVRYSDLGLPVDFSEEERVVTRTTANGFFRLPQLTERYLVRICAAEAGAVECSTDPVVKSFAPSYVGPGGTTVSWLRQTSMFPPRKPSRSIGEVTVKPSAVLAGTFKGGANQMVYLLRGDDSVADRAFTDEKGKYRFEVAGGTYRVEVDKDPGLRNDFTVPGFRSDKLKLKPGKIKHLSFRTRHAGVVRGTVTSGGSPVADVFVALLDENERFAAGVVTDEAGQYAITSLKPGSYTVRTSVGFSDYVAQNKPVTLEETVPKTVDLALDPGATVRFTVPAGTPPIAAELRNQAGRVMKVYQGDPAEEPGGQIVFRGLPAEQYKLYVRKAAFPFAPPKETDFPWTQRNLDVLAGSDTNLGPVALDQASIALTGRINKGSQLKITALPQDPWLRESHEVGDQVTPMALNWTEAATKGGAYTAYGMVPGTYSVLQTTSYRDRGDKGTAHGGNIATTLHTVTVAGATTTDFIAPKGASVTGRMKYASNGLPVIAPIGFRVYDSGPQSWLFPTVSGPQKPGKPFRVERLHKGAAVGRLLDLDALYEEHPDTLIPDTLVSSARLAEAGTPYWLTAKAKRFTLTGKQVLDLGVIKVLVRGLDAGSR